MLNALGLLKQRRFLPLFTTQFLGAFNDNLFKTSMVLFATYAVFNDPKMEANFNALATGLGILPFFLLSALAGQLADSHDKARIIRIVKTVEIGIMLLGATGLMVARAGHPSLGIGLMLGAVLCLGVHSTFFGPIKYAILPQHLAPGDVLGGTGLVEAGTYLAILLGTVTAGWIPIEGAAASVLIVAVIGWFSGRQVPPAPREGPPLKLDYNPFTASWRLISATLHIPRLFLAIIAISFFWTIGAVLIIVFPPLVKNVLTADERVASFVIAVFSVGVAIGSVVINSMLRGRISAKFSPASVIAMGGFVVLFSFLARNWTPAPPGQFYDWAGFIRQPGAIPVLATLLAIAITGGMFVVPLYAFLTTTVERDQTARTVAANNVVNSGAMTIGSILVIGITALGVTPENMLFLVAAMCLVSAWLAQKLHLACDDDANGCLPGLHH
ncbi:MFS transporter [Sphingomonas aurantiaca]|jgi:MFS family permease|uniref:MFS transporter n=1 Tax=Sphingomonas aurantiaca TaxID=185949 RepID=A0A2T5GNW8_9SPHN|nr:MULTISPECIES: MFS transporter [Sphingomonas]KQN07729.1 MFS transporter [Sphingomonas sp. Leaf28]PTQ61024.1 MFS transporter [Sphingomonas aurantiaca]